MPDNSIRYELIKIHNVENLKFLVQRIENLEKKFYIFFVEIQHNFLQI